MTDQAREFFVFGSFYFPDTIFYYIFGKFATGNRKIIAIFNDDISNKVTNKPATVSITMATGRPTMLSTTTTTTISRPTTVSAATTTSRPAMLSITMATGRPTMVSTTTAISRQPPDTIAIISSNQHAKLCGSFCLLSLQLRSDFLVCLCYSESSLQSSL